MFNNIFCIYDLDFDYFNYYNNNDIEFLSTTILHMFDKTLDIYCKSYKNLRFLDNNIIFDKKHQ